MASSSTNSSKNSDDQNNKSDQLSKTSDESEKILPTSSNKVEVTISAKHVGLVSRPRMEQQNDLSPHLIRKESFLALSACPARGTELCQRSTFTKPKGAVPTARPFEEILVGPATSDISSGSLIKPEDGTC